MYGDGTPDPEDWAIRYIEDGVFVDDCLGHSPSYDGYRIDRPLSPGAGERFIAEWRLWVDARTEYYSVSVAIAAENPPRGISFQFGADGMRVSGIQAIIPLAEDQWHVVRFESDDLFSYDLFVDETWVYAGELNQLLLESYVAFGNGGTNSRQLSKWDYFRFGVVPEPNGWWTSVVLVCAGIMRTRS